MAVNIKPGGDYPVDAVFGEYNPEHFYRRGLSPIADDFRAQGKVFGTEKYDWQAYFEKGRASTRYGRGANPVILEAAPSDKIQGGTTDYFKTDPLNPLTKEDRIRLWEMGPEGKYVSTYDNITPWKHAARGVLGTIGRVVEPVGAMMLMNDGLEYARDQMEALPPNRSSAGPLTQGLQPLRQPDSSGGVESSNSWTSHFTQAVKDLFR